MLVVTSQWNLEGKVGLRRHKGKRTRKKVKSRGNIPWTGNWRYETEWCVQRIGNSLIFYDHIVHCKEALRGGWKSKQNQISLVLAQTVTLLQLLRSLRSPPWHLFLSPSWIRSPLLCSINSLDKDLLLNTLNISY